MKHKIRTIHRYLKRSYLQVNLKILQVNAKVYEGIIRFKAGSRRYRTLVVVRGGGILAALVLVFHILSPAFNPQTAFALNGNANLNGYIWEMDDGSTADGNTQLAAGNGTISVPKGSRLNLRTQIKNTGTAMDLSKVGLFYDRGDGVWGRVKNNGSAFVPGGTMLADTSFMIDDTGTNTGQFTSTAFDNSGAAWVSYYDTTNTALRVAKYVGSGGNCTHAAWNCSAVDNTATNTGQYTAIAIDGSGNPWVSYYDATAGNLALKVAKYVGGGTGNCTDNNWNCWTVDNTGTDTGQYTGIAIDGSGNPWVSYYDVTNTALRVAKYVGGGTGNCTDNNWRCTAVDNTGTQTGQFSSIAIDPSGNGWVSYYDTTNTALRVAIYVGGGAQNCTDSDWKCSAVDNTASVGQYTDITFNGLGTAFISYYATTGTGLKVATYVGGAGLCTDAEWECSVADSGDAFTATNVGQYTSITVDAENAIWISYYDTTNTSLRILQYPLGGGTDNQMTIEQLDVGQYSSVAIDPSGNPWVSFFGNNSQALFYKKVTEKYFKTSLYVECTFISAFDCTSIDAANSVGEYTSIAVGHDGSPWISYYDTTADSLKVANYNFGARSSSSCNTSTWDCVTVDNTGTNTGQYTSIAIDQAGNPWVSYYDVTNSSLRVARYVGSGGNCTNSTWSCSAVDNTGTDTGQFTSIAFDAAGAAWVSYYDVTNTSLRVAKYVGGGTGNCTDNNWNCWAIDNTATSTGQYSAIAIDGAGNPWVSYYDSTAANQALRVARYVGGGTGNCTDNNWNCSTVDNTGTNTGQFTSIAMDPSGNPWVSFYDVTNTSLRVANFVTSGGSCTDTAWNCSVVENNNISLDVGSHSSIAFDPSGVPWISYYDVTETAARISRYVGSGGNCTSTAWSCSPIDNENNIGQYTSIAFDQDGKLWSSYYDSSNTAISVGYINRAGAISLARSERSLGTSLSESHVDMSTVSDTTNRDDADCVGGGTWNNGFVIWSERGINGTLPSGTGTAQCTELMFTIDLHEARAGQTYRFMIASLEPVSSGKNYVRGPVSIAGGATPTLTVTDASMVAAKDSTARFPNCTDTAWGCESIDTTNNTGSNSATVIDRAGRTWVSFYDSTNSNLRVAQYVGTGGTGCASSAWTCTDIDTTNDAGTGTSIAIDPAGNPWISYVYGTGSDLRVAQYVGSGGTGCASSAWTCTDVDTASDVANNTSIDIDTGGNAWVSYVDVVGTGDLKVARYVGSGGTGCASTAWTCSGAIHTSSLFASDNSISLNYGKPWISWYVDTNLMVLEYVGFGGTGCNNSSAWRCTMVDSDTDTTGLDNDIISLPGPNVYVSYYDQTATSLMVAKYVASGGTGCGASGSAAWTCTVVDNDTDNTGQNSSISAEPLGNMYVSYIDTTAGNLMVARHVTSGGSGCGASGSSAWSCSAVINNITNAATSLAFDTAGTPWVSYYGSSTDLRIAKMHYSLLAPKISNGYSYDGVSPVSNFAKYTLNMGRRPSDSVNSCTNGTADYYGVCGLFQNSGNYETITTQTNESAFWTFAMRFTDITELPTAQWIGKTSLAPNTAGTAGDIYLQVYRYGTTNAWETIASNTASSDCNSDNCTLRGTPSGTLADYFTLLSGFEPTKHVVYYRLYQEASASGGITFKTDQFSAFTTAQKTGTGSLFQDGIERPLNQR